VGYGLSANAYHITAPSPNGVCNTIITFCLLSPHHQHLPFSGNGAYQAMASALKHPGLSIKSVDYINAHATSMPLGFHPPMTHPCPCDAENWWWLATMQAMRLRIGPSNSCLGSMRISWLSPLPKERLGISLALLGQWRPFSRSSPSTRHTFPSAMFHLKGSC